MQDGKILLGLSVAVLSIFSLIMEVYSYRFLLNQRTKEFGLYNILGMTKKQVGLISTLELVIIYFFTIVIGSLVSAIFSHVFYLIFVNLIHYDQLRLTLSPSAFIITILSFAFIFLICEIVGLIKIRKTSPLMLFQEQEKGEKEPKGNGLLALLSIVALSVGYYLSLSSKHIAALAVLYRFFIAVVLVIIGTYLFYISFMTWYLKKRRQNKAYFYKPEHFVSTSQMIFRMKQNAVGLANITILSIMTFVTIATTTALYYNTNNMARQLYPKNTTLELNIPDKVDPKAYYQEHVFNQLNLTQKDYLFYRSELISIPITRQKEVLITKDDLLKPKYSKIGYVYLMTQKDFKALGNKIPHLSKNQTAFYTQKGDSIVKHFNLLGMSFDNIKNLQEAKLPEVTNTYNPGILVVSDEAVLAKIYHKVTSVSDLNQDSTGTYKAYANLTQKQRQLISDKNQVIYDKNKKVIGHLSYKSDYLSSTYAMTGGFLFTGFLLGLSFILGTALIIYYKQYSEGIEDKKAYHILQEVGMSQKQVKQTINSQILMVFFMPIALAIIHFVIALTMLKQMLLIFGVLNSSMIYLVSAITILVIIGIYFLIYRLTGKTYYSIIER